MSLKFEIYRDGTRVMQFTPVAPMAMGPESVPLHSEIVFRDGFLVIQQQWWQDTVTRSFSQTLRILPASVIVPR